jgi:colicin import membrane protein
MSSAALAPDNLLPRPPGGLAPGAMLALLVHGLLIAALTAGVDWRSSSADAVSAELWAAVPQSAAPRAVEAPTPPPVAPVPKVEPTPAPAPSPPPKPVAKTEPAAPDAQIAIERARREAAERERASKERADKLKAERDLERARDQARDRELERVRTAEAERLKQADAAKKREAEQRAKAAEEKRLSDQRAENLKRMLGQAGATGSPTATGTAARDAAPSASYVGRLVASIKPNIVFNEIVPGNPAAEVEVRSASSGTIISRRLIKSSGNKEWDDAVLRAIDRTGTLPRDVDGRVPPSIVISFRPQE